jgi:hypothetical protein
MKQSASPGGFETSPPRVALALLAGAASGAALVTAQWLRAAFQVFGAGFVGSSGPHGILVVFIGALIAWLAGLVLIGGPAWWLLHRYGLRGWKAAILTGMALTFVAALVLAIPLPGKDGSYTAADRGGETVVNNALTAHGWAEAAEGALLISFVGGAVAFVVWRTAYRRV